MSTELQETERYPVETTNLVKHYFNICNTALSQASTRPGRAAAVALLDQLASGVTVTVTVTGQPERVDETDPRYTTTYIDGQFTPILEGEHGPDARVSLTPDYLREVLESSDECIEDITRLEWSWLRQSL